MTLSGLAADIYVQIGVTAAQSGILLADEVAVVLNLFFNGLGVSGNRPPRRHRQRATEIPAQRRGFGHIGRAGMDVILTEGLSLILRWLHVVAGIAWIGSSFYFIHLDLSLKPNLGIPPGAHGEAWQVHGGGFYNMVKYLVAPARLPDQLTWFKWEAYTTWLSGFALMIVTYYLGAELFLVDESVFGLSATTAIVLSVTGLLFGWIIYEGLCRSPFGRDDAMLALTGFVFLVALAYGFTLIFSGRGAFVEMGALIGTMMVANVFVIIIPNQKKVVAALVAGRVPDPALGKQSKQRSVHNNYLTLPVAFLMINNHYPLIYATRFNWLIFAVVLVVGALIRHFYNCRHAGKPSPWWTWIAAVIGMAAIAWLSLIGTRGSIASAAAARSDVRFAEVEEIIVTRCGVCHAEQPAWAGFSSPPRNVLLDTPEHIRSHARQIEIAAVLTDAMPPGNITEISDGDRRVIGAWLGQGMPTK